MTTVTTTCDSCLEGWHRRCKRSSCCCSVCAARSRSPLEPRVRSHTPRVPKREPVRSQRVEAKSKYGVLTDFPDEEVEFIFEGKAAGRSIAGIARDLGTSRDRVRTIYYCPVAPEAPTCTCESKESKEGSVTGNEHLDKAIVIMEGVKDLFAEVTTLELMENKELHKQYLHLVDLASVQASIAQAAAQTRIAMAIERSQGLHGPGR